MSALTQQLEGSVSLERVRADELQPATDPITRAVMMLGKGVDAEQLLKLMELQERYEANEARKAFNVAMAKFKDDPPKILKNKHVKFATSKGTTEYDHATLDHVCDQITAALAKVGITHKWVPKQVDGKIAITCVLTHELGYRDPDPPTLIAPSDESGGKNVIQGIGSTVTYLERYTLLAAVGMASGMDDDGRATSAQEQAEVGSLSQDDFDYHLQRIESAQNIDNLLVIFKAAYGAGVKANDESALGQFGKAKELRKKEIRKKELSCE